MRDNFPRRGAGLAEATSMSARAPEKIESMGHTHTPRIPLFELKAVTNDGKRPAQNPFFSCSSLDMGVLTTTGRPANNVEMIPLLLCEGS